MGRVHLYNNLFLTFYSCHKTVKELSNIVINIIKGSCEKRFFFYFFNVLLLNSNDELSVFLMTFILIFFKRKGGKRGAYYFCSICHFVILSRTLHTTCTCVILKYMFKTLFLNKVMEISLLELWPFSMIFYFKFVSVRSINNCKGRCTCYKNRNCS